MQIKSGAIVFIAPLCLVSTLVLIIFAGCSHPKDPSMVAAPAVERPSEFVGNAACKPCHRSEFIKHNGSRHDLTMRDAKVKILGDQAPPAGTIGDTQYRMKVVQDSLLFASTSSLQSEQTAQIALGSGKTGTTYIHLTPDNRVMEIRMSWFPHLRKWLPTPGDAGAPIEQVGMVYDPQFSKKCLLCHSVSLQKTATAPAPGLYGVGCESCHGPGGKHVTAMQAGDKSGGKMEHLSEWGGKRLSEMCGKCHQTAKDIDSNSLFGSLTNRFQPYGLMQSRCFKESNDKLTCATCHDVHSDVSKSATLYEQKCLKCHATVKSGVGLSLTSGKGKPCPVNPKSGCIHCHMPQKEAFPGMGIPTKMADHLIVTYGKKGL